MGEVTVEMIVEGETMEVVTMGSEEEEVVMAEAEEVMEVVEEVMEVTEVLLRGSR